MAGKLSGFMESILLLIKYVINSRVMLQFRKVEIFFALLNFLE
jgi:hypothetical protein